MAKGAQGRIVIGDQVRIGSDFARTGVALYAPCKLRAYGKAEIHIGERVALAGTSICCRSTRITIGPQTIIGPNVVIVDADFHAVASTDRLKDLGYEADRPVTMGRNVWIGMGTLVLKGVTIGENSVIQAGSVVVGKIPANVVAGGHPARVLRPLAGRA